MKKKVEGFISSRVSHLFGGHSEQYKYELLATLLLSIFLLPKVRRRTPLCVLHFNWRLENVHVTFSPLICSLFGLHQSPSFSFTFSNSPSFLLPFYLHVKLTTVVSLCPSST